MGVCCGEEEVVAMRSRPMVLTVLALSLMVGGCTSETELDTPPSMTDGSRTSGSAASESNEPPTGKVEGALWQALMSPDGEYASSASYAAVIARHGEVEPYVTIRAAEERHIAALTRQLQRLGVEVPDNPWTGQVEAPEELRQAAADWAEGEVANVALYDRLLDDVSSDRAAVRVFTNLRRASLEAHLPLFEGAAQGDGTLTAEKMVALGHAPGTDGRGPAWG